MQRGGKGSVCASDRDRQMVLLHRSLPLMQFSSALITAGSILTQFKQIEGIVNTALKGLLRISGHIWGNNFAKQIAQNWIFLVAIINFFFFSGGNLIWLLLLLRNGAVRSGVWSATPVWQEYFWSLLREKKKKKKNCSGNLHKYLCFPIFSPRTSLSHHLVYVYYK